MKTQLNLKSLLARFEKLRNVGATHLAFVAILVVLLAYLYTVQQINKLASTEPSPDAVATAETKTKIPKIDQNAVKQIQSLEQSNSDIHSLFDAARKSPFQE